MEVLVALPSTMDFNFDSNCSTPYMSAPSSPKLFGELYYSAPASPTRSSTLYHDFNQRNRISLDTSPFEVAQNSSSKEEEEYDFAFDFSGQYEKASSTADELFDGGKIKPFSFQLSDSVFPPKSPKPSKIRKQEDPSEKNSEEEILRERGSFSSTGSKHRSTKSLSDFVFEEEEEQEQSIESISSNSKSSYSFFGKWRFRDFLLFRSASEGRATRKDPLKKFTALSKKHEALRNSSIRSSDGSVSGSSTGSSRRRGPVSAHELHYTSNRAVQDELKRKTYLPYKKGLLGCVGFEFDPTIDGISRGLNSIKRG